MIDHENRKVRYIAMHLHVDIVFFTMHKCAAVTYWT